MNLEQIKLAAFADELEKIAGGDSSSDRKRSRYLVPASIAGGALALGGGAAAAASMIKRRRLSSAKDFKMWAQKMGVPSRTRDPNFNDIARKTMGTRTTNGVRMPENHVPADVKDMQEKIRIVEGMIETVKKMGAGL